MELVSVSLKRVKLPPRKWRICDTVGVWGVGASGSTAAMTKGPRERAPMIRKDGGPAVAGYPRSRDVIVMR